MPPPGRQHSTIGGPATCTVGANTSTTTVSPPGGATDRTSISSVVCIGRSVLEELGPEPLDQLVLQPEPVVQVPVDAAPRRLERPERRPGVVLVHDDERLEQGGVDPRGLEPRPPALCGH